MASNVKTSAQKTSSAARVKKHRDALRKKGLRPVQIWVPDRTAPGFAEEARRQCLAINSDPQEKEILDFIEQVADLRGWV